MKNFTLTKDERAQFDDLYRAVDDTGGKLVDAQDAFNAALEAAREALQPAIDAYNEAVEGLKEFAADIASVIEEDLASKSERWCEGERGQQAAEFLEHWQGLSDLSTFNVEPPEPLDVDDPRGDLPEQSDIRMEAFDG